MATATAEIPCPVQGCDWKGKTKGSLTQHINKKHDDPLAKLRADFGDMSPQPGGAINKKRPLQAAPSGVPSIDYILGIGGIPRGTVIEIFGPPRAGKTLTALTFSAHAQKMGELAGFVDAERAMQETFLKLVPGLDVEALEFSEPPNGTKAMEITRRFVKSGAFGVWTVDSIHACIPEAMLEAEIGSGKARAQVAQLMSESLPVLANIVADTHTSVILINHIKQIPGQTFGRDWYTPGGSAPEYYASTRLHVWQSGSYVGVNSKKQIGHRVKVKVEKSKATAPFTTGEFDLYYHPDVRKDTGRMVTPGIDVESSWLWVLEQEGRVAKSSAGYYLDTQTGEKLGNEGEVMEMLADPGSALLKAGSEAVYPKAFA